MDRIFVPAVPSKMHVLETEACVIHFLDKDIVHVHFKEDLMVSPEQVQEMFDKVYDERDGRKALLLVTVGEGTTMSNESRAYASSEASGRYVAADAIVVRDFSHQLAANVFVRHHKPSRPIRMFPDKESAVAWLHTQKELIDAQ